MKEIVVSFKCFVARKFRKSACFQWFGGTAFPNSDYGTNISQGAISGQHGLDGCIFDVWKWKRAFHSNITCPWYRHQWLLLFSWVVLSQLFWITPDFDVILSRNCKLTQSILPPEKLLRTNSHIIDVAEKQASSASSRGRPQKCDCGFQVLHVW